MISKHKRNLILKSIIIFVLTFLIWIIYILGSLRIFLPYYPFISGFPFSKNYIVLFQNNYELRPTGGFISAYGILNFKFGIPTSFQIFDSYSIQRPEEFIAAPYPIDKLLAHPFYEGFTFRDANYSPDLKTSAYQIIKFYNLAYPNKKIDGIITVNTSIIEDILSKYGSIKIKDIKFDQYNYFTNLEYLVTNIDKHNIKELENRKNILNEFYKALMYKIILTPAKYPQFTDIISASLDNKNIQFYTNDNFVSSLLARKNWDGKFPNERTMQENDFLGIIESNLGGVKSNRYISKYIEYDIYIQKVNNEYIGEVVLNITLKHNGVYNEPLSYVYNGFLNIFTKDDIKISDHPEMHISYENGYKTLGYIIKDLHPKNKITFTYNYILPKKYFQNNKYNLFLFKQSGTNDYYDITIHFPPDYIAKSNTFNTKDNIATYKGNLLNNKLLRLNFIEDKIPPRITIQAIINEQEIELHTNEILNQNICENIDNYNLYLEDKKININSIDCSKDRHIFIKIDNKFQKNIFYTLYIQDIQDLYENIIYPNPFTATLIYR